MNFKIVAGTFSMVIILNSLLTQSALALSCIPSVPLVGTVTAIADGESGSQVMLNNYYTFSTDNIKRDNLYVIDVYEKIIADYIAGDTSFLHQVTDTSHFPNSPQLSFPPKLIEKANISVGDIIIFGPPHHVCNYGFTGIFSPSGRAKSAIIKDGFEDYSYHQNTLTVSPGTELSCTNGRCVVAVNFAINNALSTLSPDETKTNTNNPIQSLALIESSVREKSADGSVMQDWGMSTYAEYILTFSNESSQESQPINANLTPESPPDPTISPLTAGIEQSETPTEKPALETVKPTEQPIVQTLTLWQKIWRFFTQLFQ